TLSDNLRVQNIFLYKREREKERKEGKKQFKTCQVVQSPNRHISFSKCEQLSNRSSQVHLRSTSS
ncbi:Hypothetical predicted protein, partial [Podarcis lilfordi]